MKKFSTTTIAAIAQLSPDTLANHNVIARVGNKNNEFICPFCDNGDGRDHTGIIPKIYSDHVGWKCQKCGEKFNNLAILAFYFGLDKSRDFPLLIEKSCALFGLPLEFDDGSVDKPTFSSNAPKDPNCKIESKNIDNHPTAADLKILEFIHADMNTPDDSIFCWLNNDNAEHNFRGLPDNFLAFKFGCRYIPDWTSPKSRTYGTFATPTKRLIIPNGANSYLARLVDSKLSYPDNARQFIKEKQHAGTKTLFNPDALNATLDDNSFCFVTEGYIDAMSVEFAGFHCVSLGGANEGDLLVKALRVMQRHPNIIILLDGDETGRKAANILYAQLKKLNVTCSVKFLAGNEISKLDANDILTEQGKDSLHGILSNIVDEAKAELEQFEQEQLKKVSAPSLDVFDYVLYFSGGNSDESWARRLEHFCGDKIRWLSDQERWLTFDSGKWSRRSDKNSIIMPFAIDLLYKMKSVAKDEDDKKLAAAFSSTRKVYSAIPRLKYGDILITADDLNTHHNLLNCLNGVLDLETGIFFPNVDPKLLITQQCRAIYNPRVDCEFVFHFFESIQPDELTRAGLLRWLGYCLTGEVAEEKFMVWYGPGGNGKGVLSHSLLELLGDYACGLTPNALTRSRNPADADRATAALNPLEGARFAISEELPAEAELNVSLVKTLCGGDKINIRSLYKEYRTINPTAKINISGNYTPKVENSNDDGLIRRFIQMPFDVKFGTPELPADPFLKKKLLLPNNLSAFLLILSNEAKAWYQGGGLIISPKMSEASNQTLHDSDFVAKFIQDNYEFEAQAFVKAKDLLDHLKNEYPLARRFKDSDLRKMIERVDNNIIYAVDRTRSRIFKGLRKIIDSPDF